MALSPKEPTTPSPAIGKIGPYTVFLTPTSPPTPKATPDPKPETPKKVVLPDSPPTPPPVQPPPVQFSKPAEDRFGLLRNAISKVHSAHSSLDEYVANWLGLNQSKYQWALDDYYEAKGVEKGDTKAKEMSNKAQCV